MLINQVGQLEHQIASLGSRQKLPGVSFEGIAGSLDREVDILLASGIDRSDLLLVTAIAVNIMRLYLPGKLTKD